MDAKSFFDLVEKMRDAQKLYFRTRDKDVLSAAKNYEKQIDAEIKRVNDLIKEKKKPKQQNLF